MSRYHKLFLSTEVIRLIAPDDPHSVIAEYPIRDDGANLVTHMRELATHIREHDTEGHCDIWLPRDQIRILSAPAPSDAPTQEQVEQILIGATPYDIDDLVYTYTIEQTTLWICAVTKVTLSEAQSFTEQFDLSVSEIGAQPNLGHYPAPIVFWPNPLCPTPQPTRAAPHKAKAPWLLISVASLFAILGGWLLYDFVTAPDDPELMADSALYDETPDAPAPLDADVPEADITADLTSLRDTVVASALDQETATDELSGEAVTEQASDTTDGDIMDPLSLEDVTAEWSSDLKEPLFDITQISALSDIYAASIDPNISVEDPTGLSPQTEVFLDRGHRSLPNPVADEYQPTPPADQPTQAPDQDTATTAQPQDIGTQDTVEPDTALTPSEDTQVTALDQATPPPPPEALSDFLIPMVRPADFAPDLGEPADIAAPQLRPEDFSILPPEQEAELVTMLQPALRPDTLPTDLGGTPEAEPDAEPVETPNAGGTSLALLETVDMTAPKLRPNRFDRTVKSINRKDQATANVQARITTRETATPRSNASPAANAATQARGIRLNKDSLIGIYGTKSRKSALMRTSNGRYVKLKVGDRFDGGKVAAIGNRELRLTKGSRNVVYELP